MCCWLSFIIRLSSWRGSHTAFNFTWWVDCLTHLCIVLSFGMFLTYLLLVLGQSLFYMYLLFYHSLTEHLLMRWSLWSCKSREFLFYTKMDEILANIKTIKVKNSFQLMKHGPIFKKIFLIKLSSKLKKLYFITAYKPN